MTIASPLPHDAARLHVTGTARFVDDIPVPVDCLHLAFGLSSIARGTIASMDLDAVRAAPGVRAVLTADDLAHANDVSPSANDEPLLSDGSVHYLGQPLFLVAATSHLAARRAARMGQVEYAAETPILTVDEALATDNRFGEGPVIWSKGNAEAAITASPRKLEGVVDIGGQEHFYLEGQVALAEPQEGGDILIRASSQHPTEIQHKIADALGQPMHSVRVETRRMGGGFGGKESQGNALAVACAVMAHATGRPCKMRYDRDDDMTITGKRHDFRIAYRVGFDENGLILGVSFIHYIRCGWSRDLSFPVADRAMLHADNAYFLPALRIESHRLRTNTQSATAFRGFGGPQGMAGIERVMDHIAHDLQVDPAELRRRNYYPACSRDNLQHSVTVQNRNFTHYGMKVEDFNLHEITEALLDSSDYIARRRAVRAWNADHRSIRRGIAFSPVKFGIAFTLTHLNQAGALVHVYQDGSIHLNHGGTEMGQGLFQKVAQIAASRFGVPLDMVRVSATDTSKVPNTSATAASSGSDLNGMAVKVACDTIRDRMARHLAEHRQTAAETVRFERGRVYVGADSLGFAEAAAACHIGRVSLSSTGYYRTPSLAWNAARGEGRPFLYFAYGAAVTEVAVDIRTGEHRLLRADILHDAGASLNPAIDIGQIEGGYVQGVGWLTMEELVWNDAGHLMTHAPSTYKIPACPDRPQVFNVTLWNRENREATVYRSKAVGEPPLMLALSAWLALSDAIASCGNAYPALGAPATPETVWRAVQDVRNA